MGNREENRWVFLSARLLVGGYFFVLGLSKAWNPLFFAKEIHTYGILPVEPQSLINLSAVLLPWFEIICGLLLLAHPLFGLGFMTLLLAVYFFVDGVCRITFALRLRPLPGWGWALFSGIVAALLGFLIWVHWPLSGKWAVGVFVGVQMIFGGWTMIAIASAARRGG